MSKCTSRDQPPIDKQRRQLLIATSAVAAFGAVCASIPFISAWWPSAKARALGAPVEVDLSQLAVGEQIVVEWRGKPVWIVRRSAEMIAHLATDNNLLRDPDSLVDQQPDYAKNVYRSVNPEFLILVGVCTHLGCSPKYRPEVGQVDENWQGGFYCPCHGSSFDLAGRVFKGVPAPINMEVPPHYFKTSSTVIVGQDKPA